MTLTEHLRILQELTRQDRRTGHEYSRKKGFLFFGIFGWVATAFVLLALDRFPVVERVFIIFAVLSAVVFVVGMVWIIYVLIQDNRAGRWLTETPEDAKIYFTSEIVPRVLATRYTRVRAAGAGSVVEASRVLRTVDSYVAATSLGQEAKRHRTTIDFQELEGRVEDEWEFRDGKREHRIGEVAIRRIFRSKNSVRVEKLGTWLVVSSTVDHEFEGETIVLSRKLFSVGHRDLEEVKLESPEFAQAYTVFSSNQREARVCLKTNVVAALTRLEQEYGKTFVEFKDQRVLVGLQTTSRLFDFDLSRDYTEANLQEALQVVHALASLSEDLNINHEYLYR